MSAGGLGGAEGRITLDISDFISKADQVEAKARGLSTVGGEALAPLAVAGSRLDTLSGKADTFGKKYRETGLALGGIGAIVGVGFGLAINGAANFEQAMDGVGASLGGVGVAGGITEEQFKSLSDEALRIGAETSFSAGEAVLAMDELAKAGQTTEQILGGSARASADLAAAIGVSIPDAAAAVASSMNVFQNDNLTASQSADILTAAVNGSATNLVDLSAGMRQFGPTAASVGLSFQEAAAGVAFFTNFGLKGADAGVSLSRALTELSNPTSEASEKMAELGIDAFDLEGNFIGLPALMDNLKVAMGDMNDEQKLATLGMIFGAEAADVMGLSVLEGGDALRTLEAELEPAGQASIQAAQRMDNFKGAMETLMGALGSLAIQLGTPLLGPLQAVAQFLAGMVDKLTRLPAPILAALGAMVLFTGALAGLAGAVVLVGPSIVKVAAQMQKFLGIIPKLVQGIRLVGLALRAAFIGNPIGLAITAIIAILALLYLAYTKNFMGFGDAVRKAGAKIKSAAKTIIDLFKDIVKAIDLIINADEPLAKLQLFVLMQSLPGPIRAVISALAPLISFIATVVDRFNQFRDTMNPISALFAALGSAIVQVSDAFGPFSAAVETLGQSFLRVGEAVSNFIDAFQALLAGDFGGFVDSMVAGLSDLVSAWTGLYEAAFEALQGIFDVITGLDWGGIIATIIGLLGTWGNQLWDWIQEGIDAIPWGSLWNGAKDATATILQKFGTWGLKIAAWIIDAVAAIPWGTLWNGAKDATGIILEKFGKWGLKIAAWIIDAVSAIPWGTLWEGAKDATETILSKFGTGGTKIADWLSDAIPSAGELAGLGAELGVSLWEAISTGISGMVSTYGPTVWSTIKSAINALPAVAGDLLALGARVGVALWDALKTGISGLVSTFGPTIWALIKGAINALPAVAADLLGLGARVGAALWEALKTGISALVGSFIPGIKTMITTAINGITAGLNHFLTVSSQVASGLWTAIKNAANEAKGAAATWVKEKIVAALNGITAAAGAFLGVAASIGSALWEDIKGWIRDNINASTLQDLVLGLVKGAGGGAGVPTKAEISGGGMVDKAKAQAPPPPVIIPAPNLTAFNAGMAAMVARVNATMAQVTARISAGMAQIGAVVGAQTAAIVARVNAGMAQIVARVNSGMAQINANVSSGWSQVSSRTQSAMSQVTSSVTNGFNQARSAAQSAMSAIASAVGNGMQQAVSRTQSAMNSIRSAIASIGNQYSAGFAIGSSLGSGIAAGISSWAGRIASAAAAVVTAGIAAANNAAASASPSKKMIELGHNIDRGLEIGIQQRSRQVSVAFRNLVPTTDLSRFGNARAQSSAAAVQNITILALKSEDWISVVRNSETGAGFARTMRDEIGLGI